MNSAEKWNLIVDGYKRLYSQPEAKVQAEWEMYCAELFEYKRLLHEIDAQRHLTVGSGGAIIPDIILRTNGNDIFDIELKQYSLPFNETFENQLISYLNQTHLSVGMLVCNSIYLYYYEYASISVNKIAIPFETDNSDGIALVEMISKDTFSAEAIKDYVLEKNRHEKNVAEIRKIITNDWIKETVKAKLLEQYSEADVDSALTGFIFKTGTAYKAPPVVISPPFPGPEPVAKVDISPIIHQWCRDKMQDGEIHFLQDSSNKKYARFTSADLDEFIPYQNGLKSGWNNGHFYSYEVVNYGGQFKMWVAFSNKNAPEQIRQVYARMMKATGKQPKKDNWEWWALFSTSRFVYNENTSPDEIINALNLQFEQVRASVKRMLENI